MSGAFCVGQALVMVSYPRTTSTVATLLACSSQLPERRRAEVILRRV